MNLISEFKNAVKSVGGEKSFLKNFLKKEAPSMEAKVVKFINNLPQVADTENVLVVKVLNNKLIVLNVQTNDKNVIVGTMPMSINQKSYELLTIETLIDVIAE